jgi:hypothetical protein
MKTFGLNDIRPGTGANVAFMSKRLPQIAVSCADWIKSFRVLVEK